jgi:D-alanine transaminase
MSRFAYVDGRFVRMDVAMVNIEDRGLQFGDSAYEVWAVRGGRLLDGAGHLARLGRSLAALRIEKPITDKALCMVMEGLLRRNRLSNALVYLQITRGVARRDHPFPASARPTLILTARPLDPIAADRKAANGIRVMGVPDIRWGRVDIKTTGLLPNVLARQAAIDAGYDDAWLVDTEGSVTEGTAQNAWIVDQAGRLRSRPAAHDILRGITRDSVADLAVKAGLDVVFEAFSLEEAKSSREAFVTSATSFVMPVIGIDDAIIGTGKPGPVVLGLRSRYLAAE